MSGDVLNSLSGVESSSVIGSSQAGVYLWNRTTGALEELGLTGPPQNLGTTNTGSESGLPEASSPVVSPNGECWVLSMVTGDSQGGTATTQVYGGVFGNSPTLLATMTRADAIGGYPPLAWGSTGVLLGSGPDNVGGGGPGFELDGGQYRFWQVVLVNPSTGAFSSQPLCAGAGDFQALSQDGELIACRTVASSGGIEVGPPGGTMDAIEAGATVVGAVAFSPDDAFVTYCTLGSVSSDGQDWAETLWSAPAKGSGTPVSLVTQDQWSGCGGYALGNDFAAVLAGVNGASSAPVDVIDLRTGETTTIGTADSVVGVL